MFTVKVRDSEALGGKERLYSAEHIETIFPHRGSLAAAANWDKAGVYLDPEHTPQEGTAEPLVSAKHVILFGGDYSDDGLKRQGGQVFITNEHGATVATYDL